MKCLVCFLENVPESPSCPSCGEASWDSTPAIEVEEPKVKLAPRPRQPKATKKLDQDELLALIAKPIEEDK